MEEVKIYGLCLQRLRYQIANAKRRSEKGTQDRQDAILLESYNTGDFEDIVDILELYDVRERTAVALWEKLEDLEFTVSLLLGDTVTFGYDENGHLGLYFAAPSDSPAPLQEHPVEI
jgi:hypothetical protein